MKKVLLVTRPITPPWDEASKNFAYFLARHLTTFDVTLLVHPASSIKSKVNTLTIYTRSELSLMQKLRLAKLRFYTQKFDVVHYLFTPNRFNSAIFKRMVHAKKTKTIQTIATLRDDIYSKKQLHKILFADLLITYSDFAKRKLQKMGFQNVQRIYPGIDINHFKPTTPDLNTLQSFGIEPDHFVITYPGEYTRLGATDMLVDLIPRLVKVIPNLKFVFACRVKNKKDAAKKQAIKKILAHQHIANYVIYTDTVTDMISVYNRSDIVLFPVQTMQGKFDVPLAVIEAMACEKPVIISNLPVLTEFASPANSIVIPVNDKDMLHERIVSLFNDPKQRKTIGRAARNYVVKNFDITQVAKKYEDAYNSLTEHDKF